MSEIVNGWKAFKLNSNNELEFLFHGFNGSKKVPLNQWLRTKRKWVRESNTQKKYRAGFHFLRSQEHIDKFNKLTKNKYVFLPVQCRFVEPKARSKSGSWLAVEIFIPAT